MPVASEQANIRASLHSVIRMAETKPIGVRIPPRILDQVDSFATAERLSRSQALIELIRRGLGLGADSGAESATIIERLEQLEKKLPNCLTAG